MKGGAMPRALGRQRSWPFLVLGVVVAVIIVIVVLVATNVIGG
jgi:hypothetical protein